jgi:hypothetical protein
MSRAHVNALPSVRIAITCAAPALLIGLLTLAPFLGSGFNIDDVTFLLQARHVLIDPLHPTAFDMVFDGDRIRLSQQIVTGPVMAYLLIPSVLLSKPEQVAHGIQLILLAVAVFSTARLALRLGLNRQQAAVAAVFVVISPAVLGMAATAMPDVPAMALSVAGMDQVVAWKQTRGRRNAIAAGLLLALAVLARPHVVLLLPCAALWLIDDDVWRSAPWRWLPAVFDKTMVPVILAFAAAALAVYVTRDPASGDTVAGAAVGRIEYNSLAFNLASFALHWVVAFPLAIAWPILRGRRFVRVARTLAAFSVGLFLVLTSGFLSTDWLWSLLIILCVGHGLDVLADIILDAWQRRDQTQIVLGLWLLLAVACAAYLQLPSKYLVPSAPAMALLIAREVRRRREHVAPLATVALAMLILGLLVLRAESELAEVGQQGGRVVSQQVKHGARVWLDGAWGFQWYGMAAGGVPLAETPPVAMPGDVVVAGPRARILRTHYPKKTLVSRSVYAARSGRVDGEGAGFFTNVDGPWPWSWNDGEIGRIEVWRIDPK